MRVMCEKIYNVPENFDGYSGRVGIVRVRSEIVESRELHSARAGL